MHSSTGVGSLEGLIAAEPTLELGRLTKRLVSEDGISSTVLASLAIEEYKRFFLLCTLIDSENEVLVPSPMVDLVWQRHQLDTSNYLGDCQRYCIPDGYLHRHHVSGDLSGALLRTDEEKPKKTVASVEDAYQFTLDRYEQSFGMTPDEKIWPPCLIPSIANDVYQQYGIAIPGMELAVLHGGETKTTESTEDEMVAELLWVGEVVRAELPKKQTRCPGQREPINQIRFYPHCDCFVPSAEQEQARLELVVREYVRFLKLIIKCQLSDLDVDDSAIISDGMEEGSEAGKDKNEENSAVASKSNEKEPFQVSPSKLVDELWHAHILRSPAYFQFCAQHAPGGQYVHHEPHFDKPHNYHEPGFNATLQAYVAEFGCPPKDVWGVLEESGGGGGGGACARGCGGGGGGGGACGRGCGGGGGGACGRGCGGGGGGACGRGCGGGGGGACGRGCGGGGRAGACGGGGTGGGGDGGRRPVLYLSCGACSFTNGNDRKTYESIISSRLPFETMVNREHSHYHKIFQFDLSFRHNQMLCSGDLFVLARSNLRAYARLVAEYGRGLYLRRRLLAIFTGVKKNEGQQHAFLRPHLVEKPLMVHIARQIYYYETAMAMVAADLANFSDDDPDSARAQRLSIYERWWERNGAAKELLASVNPLLARFNVRLVKQVETVNTHMYDHYLLVPTIEPYLPPLPPHQNIVGTTILRWEELKERMLARKAELAKKWFKYLGQWETETYVAQNEWLASTNTQLKEHQIVAYFPIVATIGRNVFWDLTFVPLVDYNELIGQHALSDRPYLRTPYLSVHPSIKPPEKAAALSIVVTDNLVRSGVSDRASTSVKPTASSKTSKKSSKVAAYTPQQVQLSVTVPAGCGPGSQLQFVTPEGKKFGCVVPPNVYAGMQFVVNVAE